MPNQRQQNYRFLKAISGRRCVRLTVKDGLFCIGRLILLLGCPFFKCMLYIYVSRIYVRFLHSWFGGRFTVSMTKSAFLKTFFRNVEYCKVLERYKDELRTVDAVSDKVGRKFLCDARESTEKGKVLKNIRYIGLQKLSIKNLVYLLNNYLKLNH